MMLEVLIALAVFAIGMLGVVKMQAVSTANSVNSEDRATAALLANDLISELWTQKSISAPADYNASAPPGSWQKRVQDALRNGVGSMTVAGNVATVTIHWDRELGRNIESGPTNASKERQATYETQVAIQ